MKIETKKNKIMLENVSNQNVKIELFDERNNGLNADNYGGFTINIITSDGANEYKQEWEDFYSNLIQLMGKILVFNFKTSNDNQVKIFEKDLITIKRYIKSTNEMFIFPYHVIEINLLARQKLEIEFEIHGFSRPKEDFFQY